MSREIVAVSFYKQDGYVLTYTIHTLGSSRPSERFKHYVKNLKEALEILTKAEEELKTGQLTTE